ncbi:GNAT family N-acetyltransferase [Paenibacillus sp. FA6]|uniref:GNAT family N-acetyltransferase n=1 Tax=Paenibacillus sp. FA6 TaxID=3413029 RepID=UPI003F65EEB1
MKIDILFSESPVFETERLILRKLSMNDLDDYYEFASDPIVSVSTLWNKHETIEDTKDYLQKVMDKYDSKQAFRWGIIYKPSNKLIGRTGLMNWDVMHSRAEIGFALASQYWNKDIISEATKEVVSYGFEKLELNRIEGRCNYKNAGSARVMEKLGMKLEGILREQLKIKGTFMDQRLYSILKSDFVGKFNEGSSIG